MTYSFLLVEDNSSLREIIIDFFNAKSNDEIKIYEAVDGLEAERMIEEKEFDLILLDVMLPYLDGFSLCRKIRTTSDVPIIFLTARTAEDDVLYGYELGCDDYVSKPFSVAELYAKSIALVKRAKGINRQSNILCGEITIDTHSYDCFVNGKKIDLPPKELELLMYLISHKGWVVSREMLLDRIWGYDYEGGTRVVDNHIKKLRNSLGEAKNQVKTVISKGYMITDGKEE